MLFKYHFGISHFILIGIQAAATHPKCSPNNAMKIASNLDPSAAAGLRTQLRSTLSLTASRFSLAGKNSGFTFVEIMIVVSLVGLLSSIAIPSFVRARSNSKAQVCISNLRIIDEAKQILLLANRSAPLTMESLKPYIGRGNGHFPSCPASAGDNGASYVIGAADEKPYCSNVATPPHILP